MRMAKTIDLAKEWVSARPGCDQGKPTSKLPGKGSPMITSARKARGRPFKPGNPGRPPGSKNKTTQALEQLAEGQAEQLVQKVLEQALEGDVASQRMMLDRVYVPPKARPINVTMPAIHSP